MKELLKILVILLCSNEALSWWPFKKIGSWRELSVSKILWYYWMIEPIMYQTLCYYVLGYIYDTHAWLQYAVMRTCAGAPS